MTEEEILKNFTILIKYCDNSLYKMTLQRNFKIISKRKTKK